MPAILSGSHCQAILGVSRARGGSDKRRLIEAEGLRGNLRFHDHRDRLTLLQPQGVGVKQAVWIIKGIQTVIAANGTVELSTFGYPGVVEVQATDLQLINLRGLQPVLTGGRHVLRLVGTAVHVQHILTRGQRHFKRQTVLLDLGIDDIQTFVAVAIQHTNVWVEEV